MKNILSTILMTLVFSTTSQASDFGIALGLRSDSATSNTASTQIDAKSNYMAGVVGAFDAFAQVQVRTGFMYTVRGYGYTPSGSTLGDANFQSLDVPVGLLWKLSDYGGPFIGANVALNVSSSCKGTCTNVNSFPAGIQLGAQFKFAPMMGAALYYESMGAMMTGIDSAKAVVAQFIITFD